MGDGKWDGSKCRAVMEICDGDGNSCQTSPDRRGLYNRKYRAGGQTDVYTKVTKWRAQGWKVTKPRAQGWKVTKPQQRLKVTKWRAQGWKVT